MLINFCHSGIEVIFDEAAKLSADKVVELLTDLIAYLFTDEPARVFALGDEALVETLFETLINYFFNILKCKIDLRHWLNPFRWLNYIWGNIYIIPNINRICKAIVQR